MTAFTFSDFFKSARIVFYLLATIVTFIIGIYIAGMLGAGEGQMLAAAAIVIGYGIMAAFFALIASLLLVRVIPMATLVRVNWLLAAILLLLIGLTYIRFLEREKERALQTALDHKPKVTLAATKTIADITQEADEMGLGFFQPNIFEQGRINFYGNVNLEKSIIEHTPNDSVVFERTETGFTSSYAPPWLYPEHMKIDYGILMFKVIGIGQEFIKVEVNRQNHKFRYVDKLAGRFISWPEMLMSINSVEPLDKSVQKIRERPFEQSSEITTPYAFLDPLLIEEDWMQVRLLDDSLREAGKGWIKWKADGKLLISYSLLS